MENIKTIYTFEVKTEKEVEKTETREENGQTITTKTKVKELVPTFFAFKKPSRVERELAEEFRASSWSDYIKKGIISEPILLKSYSNAGGVLSELQKKEYSDLRVSLVLKMEENQKAKTEFPENSELHNSLFKEVLDIRDKIITFEREQSTSFENTAEAKARLKVIEWLILHLTYFRIDAAKNWEPFFKGDSIEKKYDSLDKFEENNDELYYKAQNRLSFISSLYLSMGNDIKKEDIESFEKEFGINA